MLLALARWFAHDIHGFNVFNYITLRAVLATMTALAISFVVCRRSGVRPNGLMRCVALRVSSQFVCV